MLHVHCIVEHTGIPREELNRLLKKLFPGHKRVKVKPITDHVNKWTGEVADGVRKVLEYSLDKSGSTKGRTRELKGKANRKGLHGFETRAVFEGYCRIVGGSKSRRKLAFEYNMAGLIRGISKVVSEGTVAAREAIPASKLGVSCTESIPVPQRSNRFHGVNGDKHILPHTTNPFHHETASLREQPTGTRDASKTTVDSERVHREETPGDPVRGERGGGDLPEHPVTWRGSWRR